uniref:Uncharacterized protein n=1 Tax=Glossina brevipalpis TaxID=37001 RepID=A0A1A9WJ62_9MUSC
MGLENKGTVEEMRKALSVLACSPDSKPEIMKRLEELETIYMPHTATLQLPEGGSRSSSPS